MLGEEVKSISSPPPKGRDPLVLLAKIAQRTQPELVFFARHKVSGRKAANRYAHQAIFCVPGYVEIVEE